MCDEKEMSDVEIISELLADEIGGSERYKVLIEKANTEEVKTMLTEILKQEKAHAKRFHNFLANYL